MAGTSWALLAYWQTQQDLRRCFPKTWEGTPQTSPEVPENHRLKLQILKIAYHCPCLRADSTLGGMETFS